MATSKATIAAGPPVANAGGPYAGIVGVALNFSGGGSTDPQGEALTYSWSFGDGSVGSGISPNHTYSTLGTFNVTLTVTNTSNLTATASVKVAIPNGRVYGGLQPIAAAHVYLFAANTTGYGHASVSLLNAASTGTSDSVGAYVLTGADGSFFWNGDYNCTPGQQIYLYALGGNSGLGTNSASGLLAVLGSCPSSGSFAAIPYITVNEVSTIAAAYAFAGFATDATHVSSSGTALAQIGVANAFANVTNLETLSTGVALATTPAGNGTVPQAEINTLANILAACVNSTGSNSSACSALFSNAESGGSSGTVAIDTATTAINIAHNPGVNVASLYALGSATPPFAPALTAQPKDFSVAFFFAGGGLNIPAGIAIDGSGNAWVVCRETSSVAEFSSLGAAVSGANGYSFGGFYAAYAVAIDESGDVWVEGFNSLFKFSGTGVLLSGYADPGLGTNRSVFGLAIDGSGNVWVPSTSRNSVAEFSNAGAILSGSNGYTGGGLEYGGPTAIDGSGNVWIAQWLNNNIAEFTNAGVPITGSSGYAGGGAGNDSNFGIAIDSSGDVWIQNDTLTVTKLSSSGAALSGPDGYSISGVQGLSGALGIAIDGSGNAWVLNDVTMVELSNSGVVLSTPRGYSLAPAVDAEGGVAVDGSGNVWAVAGPSVTEFIGAGTPVVTPLSVGVKNNTLGTRP
jgi:hypothetical protein